MGSKLGKPSIKDVIKTVQRGINRVELYVLYPMIPKVVIEHLIARYQKIKKKKEKGKKT